GGEGPSPASPSPQDLGPQAPPGPAEAGCAIGDREPAPASDQPPHVPEPTKASFIVSHRHRRCPRGVGRIPFWVLCGHLRSSGGPEMPGHGSKKSRKQAIVIGYLLSEPTQAGAAARAGIAEKTLRRWLADPEFMEAYRQARRRVVEEAVAVVQRTM